MASREGGGAVCRLPLRVGQTQEYRMGRNTQLLAVDGSPPVSLYVLCGDRFEAARLFRSGGFSVQMIRVEGHPVSMASCTVGDHQWMLARDALVARLDARVFVFELPGFFYAVVVPRDAAAASERKCATLAEIFSRFCAYHDLSTPQGADEAGDMNQHPNPWVRAHGRIQRLKRPISPAGHPTADATAEGVSCASQMERAVRTSAVVKLLSRSLLAGALRPARHLTITCSTTAVAANAGTSAGAVMASTAALPSKLVVSDLLDAIETSRTAPRRDARRGGGGGGGGLGWWCLNVEGVMLLLKVIQAVRGRGLAAPAAAGTKRPRDEAGDVGLRGGGGAARRWCGGRPRKLGNTVGACGSS